jgi:hypothetical protein
MASEPARCDRLVVNSVLCFTFKRYNTWDMSRLRKTLFDFYKEKPEAITFAKRQLIDDASRITFDKPLPRYSERYGPNRYEHELKDVLDIITAIDERNSLIKLPEYVISDIDSIPVAPMVDGELKYLLTKIDSMEASLIALQGTVRTLCTTCSGLNHSSQKVSAREVVGHAAPGGGITTTQPGVTRPTGGQAVQAQPQSAPKWEFPVGTNKGKPTVAGEVSRKTWADAVVVVEEEMSSTEAEGRSGTGDDDGFMLMESRRRKKRRLRSGVQNPGQNPGLMQTNWNVAAGTADSRPKQTKQGNVGMKTQLPFKKPNHRRQPLLYGRQQSMSSVNTIHAAKTLKAVYYVDNVSMQHGAHAMAAFVLQLGVRVVSCFEVKPRLSMWQRLHNVIPDHRAFRVCINKADANLFLNASSWPNDITISLWFSKKNEGQERQTAAQMVHNSTAIGDGDGDLTSSTVQQGGSHNQQHEQQTMEEQMILDLNQQDELRTEFAIDDDRVNDDSIQADLERTVLEQTLYVLDLGNNPGVACQISQNVTNGDGDKAVQE